MEADYREMNTTFGRVIRSGFAFSATRWIGCIVRQYECSEALNKARYTPPDDAGKSTVLIFFIILEYKTRYLRLNN